MEIRLLMMYGGMVLVAVNGLLLPSVIRGVWGCQNGGLEARLVSERASQSHGGK